MSLSSGLISFESSTTNNAKRQEKRQIQEKILSKAQAQYEKAERIKQQKKDAGETTWILPHLDQKLSGGDKKEKKKKKKDKKTKKKKKKKDDDGSDDESEDDKTSKKKKKKSKKKKRSSSSSSSSDDDHDDDQWCEKKTEEKKKVMKGPTMERDDWMARAPRGPAGPPTANSNENSDSDDEKAEDKSSSPSPSQNADPSASTTDASAAPPDDPFADLIPTTSIKDIRRDRDAKRNADRDAARAANEAAAAARELNPYWRTGEGTGLPPERKKDEGEGSGRNGSAASWAAAPVANDGGASWIQKAYKRCVEQAEREGKTLEEVAAVRYGSLDKLKEMMWSAGARTGGEGSGGGGGERRGGSGGGWRDRRDMRTDDRGNNRRDDCREDRRCDRRGDERDDRDGGRDELDDRGDRRREERGRKDDKREDERDGRSNRRGDGRDERRDRRDDDCDKTKFKRDNRHDDKRRDDRRFDRSRDDELKKDVEMPKFARPGLGVDGSRRPNQPSAPTAPSWKKKPTENESAAETCTSRNGEKSRDDRRNRKSPASSDSSSDSSSSSEDEDEKKNQIRANDGESRTMSNPSNAESETKTVAPSRLPPAPSAAPLSKAEMNTLGAKILKAELRGDKQLAESLKAKLEAGREAAKNASSGGGGGGGSSGSGGKQMTSPVNATDTKAPLKKDDQELVLTRVDREGNVWPVERPTDQPTDRKAVKRAKKKNERETHDDGGKRTRYFADDDKYSLKDLIQQEKMTSAQDQANMFNSRAAARLNTAAIRGEAEGNDGDFAVDDVFVAKSGAKRANVANNTFQLDKSIFQSKKIKAATENCQFCIDNEDKFLKHLMVSLSDKACLLLPSNTSLVEGHCYIVPLAHVTSVTGTDEDVNEEMQKYRKCLVDMFAEDDLDCVFMETVLHLNSHPHAVVECVPLERELGDMAPIYFKKAMMESDVEWAINKRIVELSKIPGNSIRRAVPKGMPYFHVDFGVNAGFAHVIEDERLFKRNFGLEILGGMMDLDPFLWRKPPKEEFSEQMKKCVDFSNKWRPFDWTEK